MIKTLDLYEKAHSGNNSSHDKNVNIFVGWSMDAGSSYSKTHQFYKFRAWIQISRQNWNGFFSNINHHMKI